MVDLGNRLQNADVPGQRMARASDFQPQWHLVMATVILALLPPVIVVAVMQKQFVKGLFETDK